MVRLGGGIGAGYRQLPQELVEGLWPDCPRRWCRTSFSLPPQAADLIGLGPRQDLVGVRAIEPAVGQSHEDLVFVVAEGSQEWRQSG